MSKNVVSFAGNSGNLPANPSDLINGLQNVGMGIQSMSVNPILRLLREGIFVYGQENIEVEEGSDWAVNPYSIEHGYAAWGDGELLGEVMVPLNQQPPAPGTLPDHGVQWVQQISMYLQCTTGQDKGITVQYKSTSKGFMAMAKKLCGEIIGQVQDDPDHIVPVVSLEHDHYTHKKYGKIYTPILEVLRWVSLDTAEPAEEPEEEPAPVAEVKKPRRKRAAPVEDVEDVEDTADTETAEPTPPRRRRRRA